MLTPSHEALQVKDYNIFCQTLLKDQSTQSQNNHDYYCIFSKIQSILKEHIEWNYLFHIRKDICLIGHRKKDLTGFGLASPTILRLS